MLWTEHSCQVRRLSLRDCVVAEKLLHEVGGPVSTT
jgi:hypothetical protein